MAGAVDGRVERGDLGGGAGAVRARPLDTTNPHNMSRLIDLISKDLIPWSTSGAKVDLYQADGQWTDVHR